MELSSGWPEEIFREKRDERGERRTVEKLHPYILRFAKNKTWLLAIIDATHGHYNRHYRRQENKCFLIYYYIYYLQKFGCTLIWNKSFFTWISDEFLIMFTLRGLSYVIIFTGFKQVEIYNLWEPSPYRVLYHHGAAEVCQDQTGVKLWPQTGDELRSWHSSYKRWGLRTGGRCEARLRLIEDTHCVGLSAPRRWLELLSEPGKVTEASLCPRKKGAPTPAGPGGLTLYSLW